MGGDKLIGEPSICNPESEPDSCSYQDTVESSQEEFVSDSVRRNPTRTFSSHYKRLDQDGLKQSLIQPLLKRMKMSENLAKRKRCVVPDDNELTVKMIHTLYVLTNLGKESSLVIVVVRVKF
jgi:hypothetical protein